MNRPPEAAPAEWTYSEYARLPDDGNRYEVLDGEVLVTPAPTPRHQKVILRLAMILVEYVELLPPALVVEGRPPRDPGGRSRAPRASGRAGGYELRRVSPEGFLPRTNALMNRSAAASTKPSSSSPALSRSDRVSSRP